MTKNLHLEHPEDAILLGNEDVIKWFQAPASTSVKIDGAPAIVFGTDPSNGRFFVGTKSVFNKRKIKIAYSLEDIDRLYGDNENVHDILTNCYHCLPRIDTIIQADFIGYGGDTVYTPNTITYMMPRKYTQKVILAPHTVYVGESIREAVAVPLQTLLDDTGVVKWIQPIVDIQRPIELRQWELNVQLTQELFDCCAINNLFLTQSEYDVAIKAINARIRSGESPSYEFILEQLKTEELTRLYFFTMILKNEMMENAFTYDADAPAAFLGETQIDYEGLVRCSSFGNFKLVHRMLFSSANFNNTRYRSADT